MLGIKSVNDLEMLQPEIMLNLLYVCNAMILCSTDNDESLQFQKEGNAIIANIDGVDMGNEVKVLLLLPGDFFNYTNDYFRYIKILKET